MAVIAVCALLVLVAVVMVVRWCALPDRPEPPPDPEPPRGKGLARSWRHLFGAVAVGFAAGFVAGALAAGAGGRLVMRLLALTSPDARGSITEAEQIVGRISVDGTVALIGFCAFLGLPTGLLYMVLRGVLPAGRAGGGAFGALLLVVASTRVEPLRADNFDFIIVGPAWLALLAFSAVVLLHGMLVAGLAERMCIAVPWAAPRPLPGGSRHAGVVTLGRVAVSVAVLVAFPGFVSAITDIL